MAESAKPTRTPTQTSPTSPRSSQSLSAEAVLDALKLILLGTSLGEVLTSITRLIEAHSDGMLCSIFLVEKDGLHLRYAAAPNLPESYRLATDGVAIGPNGGPSAPRVVDVTRDSREEDLAARERGGPEFRSRA
jgi:hypothetical protein